MPNDSKPAQGRVPGARIEGRVQLEAADHEARNVALKVYAFDRGGNPLGEAEIGAEGKVSLDLKAHEGDVELVVSAAEEARDARRTGVYTRVIKPADWVKQGALNVYATEILLEPAIWRPLVRTRFCISGHVRKVSTANAAGSCPVPFVKVEIYDVDREWCWWPHLQRWWEYLDRRVVRLPELIRQPKPRPIPGPGPGPIRIEATRPGRLPLGSASTLAGPALDEVMLNPQPLPPREVMLNPQPLPPQAAMLTSQREPPANTMLRAAGSDVMFNPQPDPPREMRQTSIRSAANLGFLATLAPEIAQRLSKATLTSRIAPWLIFPRCFYSKRVICETYTDCDGFFRCCFRWSAFHYRNGHFRHDPYPDVILKITQVVSGVETVVYTDPYTNTRWNFASGHVDLYLDDESVVCGSGCGGSLPGTSQAAILQIGSDPVWAIDQADGKYHTGVPNVSNGAYQGTVTIKGDFSADLKTGPKRYYRLSWAPDSASPSFTPIQVPLSVLRAPFLGVFEPYLIGPQPGPGPLAGLYEVQDMTHWWINPGPGGAGIALGYLASLDLVPDEGAIVLRLEVFDETGTHLAAVQFPNHGGNGTGVDPDPPPVTVGHQDLKVYVDNKPMDFSLTTPATNACGVVVWSPGLTLAFDVHADQENGRVHSWSLVYVKGVNPAQHLLGNIEYAAGTSPVDESVNGNVMLTEPVTPDNPAGELQSTLRVRTHSGRVSALPQRLGLDSPVSQDVRDRDREVRAVRRGCGSRAGARSRPRPGVAIGRYSPPRDQPWGRGPPPVTRSLCCVHGR